jgi:hypothetical protein
MKKELTSSNPLIKDFINSVKQKPISKEDKLKEAEEHKKISVFLYDTSEKLLNKYGKEHFMQLSVGAGRGRFGMHLETVGIRSTPMVSIETEDGEIMFTVSEGYTTGPDYYKNKDRVVVSVFFDFRWTDLLDISKTKEETKNWLGKKATPEQLGKAINLFPVIEGALKKNSKIKPAKIIDIKEAESILLGKSKASER